MSNIVYPNGHKRIGHGEPERFIRSLVGHVGDACVPWPYGVKDRGYGLATIDGKQSVASRWMCELAHGEPPFRGAEAAHNCGNAPCVNPNHLRWDTPKGNAADRVKHGTHNRGERSGKTSLTASDVEIIKSSPPNLKALAERFGVSKGCISKIRSGQRWAA
jgi:hypothetical protein